MIYAGLVTLVSHSQTVFTSVKSSLAMWDYSHICEVLREKSLYEYFMLKSFVVFLKLHAKQENICHIRNVLSCQIVMLRTIVPLVTTAPSTFNKAYWMCVIMILSLRRPCNTYQNLQQAQRFNINQSTSHMGTDTYCHS